MAFQNTDLLLLYRPGDTAHYQDTVSNLALAIGAGGTNLSLGTITATAIPVNSDTGTDVSLPLATAALAGLYPPADFAKMANISVTQAVDLDAIETEAAASTADIADIRTMTGTTDGATNMGAFTGGTITDNSTLRTALQDLETAVEAVPTRLQSVVADITARDAIAPTTTGDIVFVVDASADATVTTGGAMYIRDAANTGWEKVAEGESLDAATNLAAGTVNATSYEITSSTGSNHAIASATGTLAGVMPAADKAKVDFLTVTGAVNLDTLATNDHVAATLAGAATNNPLTLTGQEFGFDISQLTAAP